MKLESSTGSITSHLFSDLRGQRFGCILADPPWSYEAKTPPVPELRPCQIRGATPAHVSHYYDTMSVQEICELCWHRCQRENAMKTELTPTLAAVAPATPDSALRLHGGYGWHPKHDCGLHITHHYKPEPTPKNMNDETTLEDILISAGGKFSGTRPDYSCDEWKKLLAGEHTVIWRGTTMKLAADAAIKAGVHPDELSNLGIFISLPNDRPLATGESAADRSGEPS